MPKGTLPPTEENRTKAIVVYESMFGNTKQLAEAVADALRPNRDVALVEVGQAPDVIDEDIGLVIVAAPTHAFSLSRENTRRDAATRSDIPIVSRGRGVRDWIETVQTTRSVHFATIDTKVRKPLLPGSAARAAARRLQDRGWIEVTKSRSFFVDGMTGPLLEGELARAAEWATQLPVRAVV